MIIIITVTRLKAPRATPSRVDSAPLRLRGGTMRTYMHGEERRGGCCDCRCQTTSHSPAESAAARVRRCQTPRGADGIARSASAWRTLADRRILGGGRPPRTDACSSNRRMEYVCTKRARAREDLRGTKVLLRMRLRKLVTAVDRVVLIRTSGGK